MFAALGDLGIWILPILIGWMVVVFTYFVNRDSLRESVTTFVESRDGPVDSNDVEDVEEDSNEDNDSEEQSDEQDDPTDEDYVPPQDEVNAEDE